MAIATQNIQELRNQLKKEIICYLKSQGINEKEKGSSASFMVEPLTLLLNDACGNHESLCP